jgi:HEAT repeat protein
MPKLFEWMNHEHECVRYWAALGCVMMGDKAGRAAGPLRKLLSDSSGPVRVAAAEALSRTGQAGEGLAVLRECLLNHQNSRVRLQAANALENLGVLAAPALAAIEKATGDADDYVKRATTYTAAALKLKLAPK